MNKENLELVFDEHFENLDNWNFEHGFVRNKELQYYTDNNVELKNGLKILGKKEYILNEDYDANSDDWKKNRKEAYYTSSSINTYGKFDFKYGVMEVKAKIPTQDGAWPAIWLMGTDGEWPCCDEVDVMECFICDEQPTILANFMYAYNEKCIWNSKRVSLAYFKDVDKNWENEYHIWKFEWSQEYMRIFIDDELINEFKIGNIFNDKFKKNYYILLNLAIGKKGLKPNENDLPLKYEIEYVKVWQNKNCSHKYFYQKDEL